MRTTFTDLPPELLDAIVDYLPTAQSVASLGQTSKHLQKFVNKEDGAWKRFNDARFPSLSPRAWPCHRELARTLCTLSRAYDRRAFVARYVEPHGTLHALPGYRKLERWKRPRGQTIGFTPRLDCFEHGGSAQWEREEALVFSAGAEICLRKTLVTGDDGKDVQWVVYRPEGACEGKDDITTLHLLRPDEGAKDAALSQEVIIGTASGKLQQVNLPMSATKRVSHTSFSTHDQPVRSSDVLQRSSEPVLLAANMGEDYVSLYRVQRDRSMSECVSSIRIQRPANAHRAYRAWSTSFLSSSHLAIGVGPSEEPLHIYCVTPTGITEQPLRKYSLQNEVEWRSDEVAHPSLVKKPTSSIYPVAALSPSSSAAASSEGQVFLSGGHDGVIRLHDLRSDKQIERTYTDPTDDSAIYSLLPRGQESFVAGTSRHSLLKFFDLRLGAKAYSYLDNSNANAGPHDDVQETNWNLFLKPHSATYPGRGGGNNWARRSAESSIYSLISPSASSPYIYAGVENAVLELAFTSVTDAHPDPVFFGSRPGKDSLQGFRSKDVLDLAMYDQTAEMMKLKRQRRFSEIRQWVEYREGTRRGGHMRKLDERWMELG